MWCISAQMSTNMHAAEGKEAAVRREEKIRELGTVSRKRSIIQY